jgi:hypothetical protein
MSEPCEHCHFSDGTEVIYICGADSQTGLICTKPKGHRGPHVACGVKYHAIETWDNEGGPQYVEEQP